MGGVSMEWKEVTISDIANLKNGKKRPSESGVIPVFGGNGIMDYVNSFNGEDTIVIGRVGAYCGCVYLSKGKCWVSDNAIAAKAKEGNDNEYLYYLLSSLNLNHHHIGGAQPLMTQDIIGRIEVIVPKEKEDQRRIASILSSLDRKIELNNKINADLEEMAQALFKNWFVDFEPFKDGKFVDSELGMIPEGWKVGTLEDLITIKYGKDHKKLEDGTFPVYGSGGLMRFVNSWLYNGESVLIPRKGTLDNIMYVCEKFWTVDTMFFSVPKMDYVMKYVYNYIKRFDFSKMNEGTSVPSNTAARLNKMQILIPTHEVLEMYDETLCPIYNNLNSATL